MPNASRLIYLICAFSDCCPAYFAILACLIPIYFFSEVAFKTVSLFIFYNQNKIEPMSNCSGLALLKLEQFVLLAFVLSLLTLSQLQEVFILLSEIQLNANMIQRQPLSSSQVLQVKTHPTNPSQLFQTEKNPSNIKSNSHSFLDLKNKILEQAQRVRIQIKNLQKLMKRPFQILESTNTEIKREICKDQFVPERISIVSNFAELKNLGKSSQLAKEYKEYYETRYNISKYPQLPFCIVVPTYNNVPEQRYLKNINSILQQDYMNYRVLIIDDGSSDGTGILIKKFLADYRISEKKISLIINPQRLMALPNLHKAAHQFCRSYEIMIIVDGDDELMGKQVLKHFNMMYQYEDIWVAYSNFMSSNMVRSQSVAVGFSRPYPAYTVELNSYRKSSFLISHLRSFVTKLFTLIRIEDLKDENGKWFRAANDVAIYMPILQMSHKRVLYCPEVSYIYNQNTGINNHLVKREEQKRNERIVKSRKEYDKLDSLLNRMEVEELRKNINKRIEIIDQKMLKPDSQLKQMGWQKM